MNCTQADSISIHEYLSHLGYAPIPRRHKGGDELRYHSPLRDNDRTPSFDVNIKKNVWNDLGLSTGGGTVQLVMHLANATTSQALKILEETKLYKGNYTTPASINYIEEKQATIHQIKDKPGDNQAVIKKIRDLHNTALIQYLESRKINIEIARKYFQEVYYSRKNQPDTTFFALAFKNDSGNGFETRNPLFKGFIGEEKTITSINLKNGKKLAIFEGAMDFVSYLSHYNIYDYENSAIVLNSNSLVNNAITTIKSYTFEKIYFFLDNDPSGNKTTKDLQKELDQYQVKDKSKIYQDFKDFNEWHIATLSESN